jgi:exodeoxyribonuclease VII large subunit
VLDRGYALVLTPEGRVVRTVTQLASGDPLTTRLADGAFSSRVETITPSQAKSKSSRKARS